MDVDHFATPEAFRARLDAPHATADAAWAFFESRPPSYRKAATWCMGER
ncbi:MAG TPA: hypothetical protein VF212_01975 [Longimicrobiales bacterium]